MSIYMDLTRESEQLQQRLMRENIVLLRKKIDGYDVYFPGTFQSPRKIEFGFRELEEDRGCYIIQRGEMTNMWGTSPIAAARNRSELDSKLYNLAKKAAIERADWSKSSVVEE